ncbi:MAG: peptidoglycan-binding domain-containing protein, partial [Candidatus Paceibacterota bacterium]
MNKKYLSVLVLVSVLILAPSFAWGQVSTTVSKVVNPVIKKYTPLATDNLKADQPTRAIRRSSNYDPAVALLQAKLTNLGTDPGSVDGINGTKTVNALKEVQRFFGMTADGVYGKESQKLFAVLPLNSSIRTTDPLVAIALKKYVKDQLKPVTQTSNIAQINTQTKLASIPFTPKGISQVLSNSLAVPGLTQVSEAIVSGTKVTAKPKILTSGTKVALYTVASSNNLGAATSNAASLNTNFSNATSGKANVVYVCGVVQKTSICTPVSFEIADAINKGTISLEQYLASKSNGGLCTTCFLDDEGNLGVITGGTGGNVNIPPTAGPAPVAEVTNMCMAYPYANTSTVAYEITFNKPIKVLSPNGLSLDVVRYYNAPGRKINAKYVSTSFDNRTLRFTAPLSSGSSIYFEGEGTLKFSPASKIVLLSNDEVVNVDILPDTFRLSSPCGTSTTYDVIDTTVTLSPDKLYGGESFGAPRHNISVKFDEPITASSSLKLVMNPSDTGGTATGVLVNDKNTPNDTLVFHFNAPLGSKWDGILGTFAFDPNSGTVKNKSGKEQLLNIGAGQDSTGGTCALKYIGQVCVEWDNSGTVKYTVVYTRDITVKTNGSNSNIKLLIDPLNSTASNISATLTGYDNKALFFSAPAQSSLLSDHVGYATLDIKNGASVFTINATLQSLGHTDQGGPADPDLGIFTATCDGSTGGDFTVTDNCMYFRQFPS